VRDPLVVAVQNRLEARKRAGVATADALSRTMFECIEAVSGKSGELNVEKLKKIAIRRRGAPIGNENRVTHGNRKGDIKRLCADIRAHTRGGLVLVEQLISHGGGGSTVLTSKLPSRKRTRYRHRFKLNLSSSVGWQDKPFPESREG